MRKISLRIALIVMTICLISMMSASAWAVPGLINFQGKLTDPNNKSLEGDYFMTFRIYTVQSGGAHLWEELQRVAVLEGIYNVQLGKAISLPQDLFDHEELYLEIAIFNYSENQDEILSPRQRLTSVPYAMKAAKSADADTLAGQPSAYYAVATEVQKRVEGKCDPGYSIREIKSDGTVVCEKDDVDDAVSDPSGTYNGMKVGYASSAGNASSASNASAVNGLQLGPCRNCYMVGRREDEGRDTAIIWPANWSPDKCGILVCNAGWHHWDVNEYYPDGTFRNIAKGDCY